MARNGNQWLVAIVLGLVAATAFVAAAGATEIAPGEGFTLQVPDGFVRESPDGHAIVLRDSTAAYAIYVTAVPSLKELQATLDGVLVSTGGDFPDWHLVGSRTLELASGLENRLVDAAGTAGNGVVLEFTFGSFIADGRALLTITGLPTEVRATFKDVDARILASVRHTGVK